MRLCIANLRRLKVSIEIKVPDIGDFEHVDVIEVLIKAGDKIQAEQSVLVLESDKASMEVPAECGGVVEAVKIKVGDKVSQGDVIAILSGSDAKAEPVAAEKPAASKAESAPKTTAAIDEEAFSRAYASPAVRRLARELGVDLGKITGSGRNQRIVVEDVEAFVNQKAPANAASAVCGRGIPEMPAIDFSQFGEIEEQKLSRINVLTGEAMTRNWLNIPHVTQHDSCDITELEAFRVALKAEAEKRGVKVTMVAFLMKALATALKEFPRFNSSLSPDGSKLILKHYFNIGVAVDTPNGLVVPVIRDVDKKGIFELSADLMAMSKKARDGKLTPTDFAGGSMTISSLGGIGGQHFTPIVNAPEVAILGVSRSMMQPVWDGKAFVPRLMLPLSLSYDHRVIDGALGAKMIVFIGQVLTDMRRSLL
ncbi:dihydrolipoyllysine-residue acetyltransferase [Dichelobacter nodosus]|nr:dihydrolipoyllysine-residue acetyltransferase [Dichelobacter nodosus]